MSDSAGFYLPTLLETKVTLKPREINQNLAQNIKRAVEKKYVGQFFSFGYVRPGTVKIERGGRSLPNKIGVSDFTGEMSVDVQFQCEVYLPQVGQEIVGRVKSINKLGLSARSENNKMTIMMFKDRQTNPELFEDVRINNRIRATVKSYKIDNQKETIIVIGDLVEVLESVYQNYILPPPEGTAIEVHGSLEFTPQVETLYLNLEDFTKVRNSRSNIDPYDMINSRQLDYKKLRSDEWNGFKNYWSTVKYMIEDYELVHPRGYNKNKGVGITPFKSNAITRAYFKMWEMLHRYHQIMDNLETDDSLTILALGEGPGGFVQAISHYRKLKYQSPPDTIYGYTYPTDMEHLRWEWPLAKEELDKLGQNLKLKYADCCTSDAVKGILKDMNGAKADLVVADGAIDDPYVSNYKEIVNYRLFFGEIVEAMLNQKIGGSFVIKVFDLLTRVTAQLLTLLNNYYDEVHITKPNFSRPANSEKYLICLGFRGLETEGGQTEADVQQQFFDLMDLLTSRVNDKLDIHYPENEKFLLNMLNYVIGDESDEFRQKIDEIGNDHLARQSEHIRRGLHLILTGDILDSKKVKMIKKDQIQLAIQWCKNYNLEYRGRIDVSDERLIQSDIVNTTKTLVYPLNTLVKDYNDSFTYFIREYPHMTFLHMAQLWESLQTQLDEIYADDWSAEVYDLKTHWLTPFQEMPSNSLKWFGTYEICDQLKLIATGKSALKVFVFHHFTGEVLRAIHHYAKLEAKRDIDWVAAGVWQEGQSLDEFDLTAKYPDRWLIGDGVQHGNLTKPKARDWLKNYFSDDKKLVDLFWSDLPFYPESEGMYAPHFLGQIWTGLLCLDDGGTMVVKQFHWLGEQAQSIWGLLLELFGEVKIVKPLASLAESSEFYLVATKFNRKKMQKDYPKILSELEDLLMQTVMNQEVFMPLESVKLTPEFKNVARYLAYRLIVLNQVPKMQIHLDIWENPRYSLSDTNKSNLEMLLSRRQDVRVNLQSENMTEKGEQDLLLNEADEINDEIRKIFKGILSDVKEDFSYLAEVADNWMNSRQVRTLNEKDQL